MTTDISDISDKKLTDMLKNGAVGVLPTDTVYGLVCVATNERAVNRLYGLKHRGSKPGTLIAASIEQLVELGLKRRYLTAVEEYWPGPVSVVIPVGLSLGYLHQGKMSLAVRVPNHAALTTLLEKTGPLLTTSANQPGKTPAVSIPEAKAYFNDTVDFYVDGGDLSKAEASTLIRIVDDAVEVLREGAVKIRS